MSGCRRRVARRHSPTSPRAGWVKDKRQKFLRYFAGIFVGQAISSAAEAGGAALPGLKGGREKRWRFAATS